MIRRGARIMAAFVSRDYLLQISYKALFVGQLVVIFLGALLLSFFAKFLKGASIPMLKSYGGDLFAFLLIGIAFTDFLTFSLAAFNRNIQEAQLMGTLELLLLSPYAFSTLLVCSCVWPAIFTSFRFFLYMFCGLFLGMSLGQANIVAALVVMVLSVLCFAAIGVIISSITLVFKRGVPLNSVVAGASFLLGGVAFPPDVLPGWMEKLSRFLPLTHALAAMRRAVIGGEGLYALRGPIFALTLFAAVTMPIGLFLVHLAVQRTKVSGTASHY